MLAILTTLYALAWIAHVREPTEEGQFRIAHPSAIFQDITRIAFMYRSPRGPVSIHFSTLESYHRNPDGDRFLLVSYEPASGHMTTQTVEGSMEARSYAYSKALNRYVLGTSGEAQLLLYDPENHSVQPLFRPPLSNTFIHRLAVRHDYAYAILSTPSSWIPIFDGILRIPAIPRFGGILKVHLQTGKWRAIPFSDTREQGWGGVQTVDPTGRVWFYRAYPLRMMWYDAEHGMRNRTLAGYDGWTVEGWDVWEGDPYLVLTNTRGEFVKRRVELRQLKTLEGPKEPFTRDTRLFLEAMRVDLYHTEDSSRGALYFHPQSSSFYRRNPATDTFSFLGTINLGDFQVMGFHQTPQEASMRWIHPSLGELEILGASSPGELTVWLRGRKTYGIANLRDGSLALHDINISNLSPANITSLVVGNDGFIYGGGYLTMSHIFTFDPATNEARLLKGAIPNAEGQINSMFTGWDGKIYGAGYPDSVLFRFDPLAPWNPGNVPTSNPVHLGPMGHHRQTRAWRGVQDLDGTVWYQSVTDYHFPIAHALARADFANRTLVVKTDLDDGFPQVRDLAVLDAKHLVLIGQQGDQPGLYLLNQREFRIESERDLAKTGGVLVNLSPQHPSASRLFLAQGKELYRVRPDLSLHLVHRSPQAISRILGGTGQDIILVGKTHIEKINLESGVSEVWWNRRPWEVWRNKDGKPGGYLFRHLDWTPVVSHQGLLFIADEEKLWRFYPPEN